MRNYESLYIIHPDVVGDEQAALVDKFQEVLTRKGAEIHTLDNWGERKLAYPIKKAERGCYVQTLFRAEPQVIADYERRLRLDEKILRFLTVKVDSDFPTVEPVAEASTADADTDADADSGSTEAEAAAEK